MRNFIVMTFDDEERAHDAIRAFHVMNDRGEIDLFGVGIAARADDGTVAARDTAGKHTPNAAIGALIGGLIGLAGGPATAAAGAAAGAFAGTFRDISALGVDALFVEEILGRLVPGEAAAVAELEESRPARLDALLQQLGGKVLLRFPRDEVVQAQARGELQGAETAARGVRPEADEPGERNPRVVDSGRKTRGLHAR